MSFASITIVGRAGKDSEVRVTQTGKEMATVSVAVGSKDKTTWFKVVGFDKVSHDIAKLKKGDQMFVQGSVRLVEYTTKAGEKRTELEVMAGVVRVFTKEVEAQVVTVESDVPF